MGERFQERVPERGRHGGVGGDEAERSGCVGGWGAREMFEERVEVVVAVGE